LPVHFGDQRGHTRIPNLRELLRWPVRTFEVDRHVFCPTIGTESFLERSSCESSESVGVTLIRVSNGYAHISTPARIIPIGGMNVGSPLGNIARASMDQTSSPFVAVQLLEASDWA
jgi:hypothetical protein